MEHVVNSISRAVGDEPGDFRSRLFSFHHAQFDLVMGVRSDRRKDLAFRYVQECMGAYLNSYSSY